MRDRSDDQINCLALNQFPVTIYNPDTAWASVSCGDEVQVEVQVVSQVDNINPVILGVIRHHEPIMQEVDNIDDIDIEGESKKRKPGEDLTPVMKKSKSVVLTENPSIPSKNSGVIPLEAKKSSSDSSSEEEEEEKPVVKKVSPKKSTSKPGVNPQKELSTDSSNEEEKLVYPKKSLVRSQTSPKKANQSSQDKIDVFHSSSESASEDEATAVKKDESSYEGDTDIDSSYTDFQAFVASLKKKLYEKQKAESESDSNEESSIEAKKNTEPSKKVDKKNRGGAESAEDPEEDEDLKPSKNSMKPRTSVKKQPRPRRCLLPSFLSTKKKFQLPKVTSPILKKSKSETSKASKSSKVESDEAKSQPESTSLNPGGRDQSDSHNKALFKVKRNLSFFL